MQTSGNGSHFVKLLFSVLLVSAALLDGCGGGASYVTVRIPPEVDLVSYGPIGIIEIGSSAGAALGRYATERFQSSIQSAQPGTRLIELGSTESVLAAIGASQLDADAVRKIGAQYHVAAVFQGQVTYSEPKVNVGGVTDLRSAVGSARVEMRGEMFAKLLETKTGASVWSNSSWATRQLGGINVSRDAITGALQSPDPRHDMVPVLVNEVTTGLRESTARRRAN
jgi:hypothetical protein